MVNAMESAYFVIFQSDHGYFIIIYVSKLNSQAVISKLIFLIFFIFKFDDFMGVAVFRCHTIFAHLGELFACS